MKTLIYLLFCFLMLSQITIADDEVETESEAEKLLKKSVNNVFAVLSNNMFTSDQKKIKVREITNSVFDYDLIAKLTLGKKYWIQLDNEQRAEFMTLFKEWYQDTFIGKLDLYSDEKIIFQPSIVLNDRNIKIPTVLLSRGQEYSIVYRMFKTQNGWKICDISIEGVSQLKSNRSQYHNAIKECGVEGLLGRMREKKAESG